MACGTDCHIIVSRKPLHVFQQSMLKQQLKDITKMKILGSYNEKIDFVDGEDYNQTVTIKVDL